MEGAQGVLAGLKGMHGQLEFLNGQFEFFNPDEMERMASASPASRCAHC
jgi:hypothetical protein